MLSTTIKKYMKGNRGPGGMRKYIFICAEFALVLYFVLSSPENTFGADAISSVGSEITPTLTIPVWPGVAPGSEDWTAEETEIQQFGTVRISNVSKPTLSIYLPEESQATGTGVIIAPGGGFRFLSINMEGHDVARWLVERGIAAFMLKYRVADTTAIDDVNEIIKCSVDDGIQALKIVREHSDEWGISADRVGFMGFSAGAMVTSMALVQADPNLRPDFAAPVYGGIFGTMPDIPSDLPPIFLAWAQDDTTAINACVRFYEALKDAGNNPELHIFNSGGHGFGMSKRGRSSDYWIDIFYYWMEANGWT